MKTLLFAAFLLLPVAGWGQGKLPETVLLDSMDPTVHSLLTTNWDISLLDDRAWADFMRRRNPDTTTAFTILKEHHTYVRRSFLETGEPKLIRFVLAHEAGHIACGCNSEKIASDFAHQHL